MYLETFLIINFAHTCKTSFLEIQLYNLLTVIYEKYVKILWLATLKFWMEAPPPPPPPPFPKSSAPTLRSKRPSENKAPRM